VGNIVGLRDRVGLRVGLVDGEILGEALGTVVGLRVGIVVGALVGAEVGSTVYVLISASTESRAPDRSGPPETDFSMLRRKKG